MMTQRELIQTIVSKTSLNEKEALAAVRAVKAAISEALLNDQDVTLPHLGTFRTQLVPDRDGRHTLPLFIGTYPASRKVRFSSRVEL